MIAAATCSPQRGKGIWCPWQKRSIFSGRFGNFGAVASAVFGGRFWPLAGEVRFATRVGEGRSAAWTITQKKWGPALLPAPTAPSEGSAGVLNLVDRPFGLPTRSRSWLTSSGVASHLTIPLARSPADLLDYVARRLAGLSTDPAWLLRLPIRRPEFSRGQYHPMFRGPSWGNHSCVPLCSPSS